MTLGGYQTMVVKYRLKRSDIWTAYWRGGSLKLNVFRVVMTALLFMAAISWARDPSSSVAARVAGAVFTACVAILLSPIYPLLRFKSDERILEIGPSGIATTIGRRSGNIAWKDVARIESNANRVYIIGKTGNSFVVPCEAFADDVEQVRFTELATQWLNSAQAA